MKQILCLLVVVLFAFGCSEDSVKFKSPGKAEKPVPTEAAKKPEEKPAPPLQQGSCKEGLFQIGAQPPDGFEKYCQKVTGDGAEIKHGPYAKWYPNGKEEVKGQYVDGKRMGHWVETDENGTVCEGDYDGNERIGKWIIRHPDGSHETGMFTNGTRSGVWVTYWDEANTKREEGSFAGGKRHGTWSYFDKHEQKTMVMEYEAGNVVSQKEMELSKPEEPVVEEAAPAKPEAEKAAEEKAPTAQ